MKNKLFLRNFFWIIFILFAFNSCKQEAIFYIISKENKPVKPRIQGSPSNMVVFEREYNGVTVPILYVASGRLHRYAKAEAGSGSPKWDLKEYKIASLSWKIVSLAVSGDYLYALCFPEDGVNSRLYRIGKEYKDNETWERIYLEESRKNLHIQSIYSDPESHWLFAGSSENYNHSILYLNSNESQPTLKILKDGTELLSGAVFRSAEDLFYLSTQSGMFQISGADLANDITGNLTQLEDKSPDPVDTTKALTKKEKNRFFMGMIKLEDPASTIIAVDRDGGYLYQVNNGEFARMRYTKIENGSLEPIDTWIQTGRYSTGALALWIDPDPASNPRRKMLLAGIQGSLYNTTSQSYSHGYVEFELINATNADLNAADGSFDTVSQRHDSSNMFSVKDYDSYSTSLGKHPINHIFQVPEEINSDLILFASTQTGGLWSYKDRPKSGGIQWNAED